MCHLQLQHRFVHKLQLHEPTIAVNQEEAVLNEALLFLLAEVFELKLNDFVLVEFVKHSSSYPLLILQPKSYYLIVAGVTDLSEVN